MDLEAEIGGLLQRGELHAAARRAIEGYGPEVFGFLVNVLRDERDASEVFSQTCEDLWRGIGRFEGRSAMRTWLYALANHAKARYRRSPHRRPGRHVEVSEVSELADRVRSRTLPYLRTTIKDQFAAIRDGLDEDDRALLVMRIDRDMSWKDIARAHSSGADSDEEVARVAARLRQRFKVLKGEIRRRAQEAGILGPEDP